MYTVYHSSQQMLQYTNVHKATTVNNKFYIGATGTAFEV